VEELEGVFSNLVRGGPVLAFSARSDHTRLEEDTLKHDIVLCHVVENLSPHLLGYFKSPLNAMLAIK
jgi:hypothetical protein